ncbi:hypothetical protein SBP02_02160 [Pseudomonas benzenivorans]|uniref:DUF3261 domain-containing protein n=1 Tax=Pseudomonas benzenivorans TaxID=556533 RepID=A0ABZ0PWK6_9PSED|nr:DUF3261 domain-containing protein [Pseudomonas benzenivorans]WPC05583.1 hypothetical protein SBP02_02160 [Pseudomonas benzenivorans]
MIRAILLGLCLLLGACATQTPLPHTRPDLVTPLPLSLHIQREQADQRQDWLLVLQAEGEELRWSLFDPLGVPLARQRLSQGRWWDDGLLPPNAEARELFAALLFALTPAEALPTGYARDSWALTAEGRRRLNPAWRIRYRAPLDFTLHNIPGPDYRVQALAPEEGS